MFQQTPNRENNTSGRRLEDSTMTATVRDPSWLRVEVCREFQRGTCSRPDTECKFAHPPKSVVVENGQVTACFDSLKGRCSRDNCKYLHPPPHIKNQLEINGRNFLATQKMLQSLNQQVTLQPVLAGQMSPTMPPPHQMGYPNSPHPIPPPTAFSPYMNPGSCGAPMPGLAPEIAVSMAAGMAPPPGSPGIMGSSPPKMNRNDKLEICREFQRGNCTRGENDCKFAHPSDLVPSDSGDNMVTICMDYIKGRCSRDKCKYFHPPPHLQARIKAAQHQANQAVQNAATAAAMLPPPPTGPDTTKTMKRPRDPADDVLLAFPGIMPMAKKCPPAAILHSFGGPMAAASYQQALAMQFAAQPTQYIPSPFPLVPNIPPGAEANTAYLNAQNQMFPGDQIILCRDFKAGNCKRPHCRYAHPDDQVEVVEGKVTICRDALKGKCLRPSCRYYHAPSSPLLPQTPPPPLAASTTPLAAAAVNQTSLAPPASLLQV